MSRLNSSGVAGPVVRIAGRRSMLEPAQLGDFGGHDLIDHFANIAAGDVPIFIENGDGLTYANLGLLV
jgi:hypothetical protein